MTNSTQIWHRCRDLIPGHIGGRRVLSPLPPCLLQIFFDSDIKTRGNSLNVTDACAKSRQLLWPEHAQRTSNLHVGPRPYAEVPLRYYNY